MTETEISSALQLLKEFGKDSRSWEDTVQKWKLEPLLLGVMSELAEIIGKQEPLICIGDITHNLTEWIEAWKPEDPREPDPRPMEPWFPNSYDATVVTEKLVVNTWGTISRELDAVTPEVTGIKALKNMASMSILARPGDTRDDGTTAMHHNISIKFNDGTSAELPDTHEGLTGLGTEKMADLIPFFYERLSE